MPFKRDVYLNFTGYVLKALLVSSLSCTHLKLAIRHQFLSKPFAYVLMSHFRIFPFSLMNSIILIYQLLYWEEECGILFESCNSDLACCSCIGKYTEYQFRYRRCCNTWSLLSERERISKVLL